MYMGCMGILRVDLALYCTSESLLLLLLLPLLVLLLKQWLKPQLLPLLLKWLLKPQLLQLKHWQQLWLEPLFK